MPCNIGYCFAPLIKDVVEEIADRPSLDVWPLSCQVSELVHIGSDSDKLGETLANIAVVSVPLTGIKSIQRKRPYEV